MGSVSPHRLRTPPLLHPPLRGLQPDPASRTSCLMKSNTKEQRAWKRADCKGERVMDGWMDGCCCCCTCEKVDISQKKGGRWGFAMFCYLAAAKRSWSKNSLLVGGKWRFQTGLWKGVRGINVEWKWRDEEKEKIQLCYIFPNLKYKCGKITIYPSRLHSLPSSSWTVLL